jgi:hypothetical protein
MGFILEANKTYKEASVRTRGEHATHTPHTLQTAKLRYLVRKLVQLQL